MLEKDTEEMLETVRKIKDFVQQYILCNPQEQKKKEFRDRNRVPRDKNILEVLLFKIQ